MRIHLQNGRERRGQRGSRQPGAFTLLEVIVACAIFFMVAFAILGAEAPSGLVFQIGIGAAHWINIWVNRTSMTRVGLAATFARAISSSRRR